MPLMYSWLRHTEATRRLIKENYGHLQGEELLEIAIAENVLTQIENLKTYPVVHSKLYQGRLKIYGWIYNLMTGEVMAYDSNSHNYVQPQAQVSGDLPDLIPAPAACEISLPQSTPDASEDDSKSLDLPLKS